MTQFNTKVKKVLDTLGVSGVKAAEAMAISHTNFRQKKAETPGHSFSEQNYNDLMKFLTDGIAKLKGDEK